MERHLDRDGRVNHLWIWPAVPRKGPAICLLPAAEAVVAEVVGLLAGRLWRKRTKMLVC